MPDPSVPYLTTPAAIVNSALDMLGADEDAILGSMTDGSRVGEAALRGYGRWLRQLLRANHWPFARKAVALTLLGDATGNSSLPVISTVEPPWVYAYAWPTDAVQGRWLMWNPVGAQPVDAQGVPLTTGTSAIVQYNLQPGRFLVSSSSDYPIEVGTIPWDQQPDLQRTEGLGPTYRKIILTDCQNANFVYTRLVTTIEEWDDSFRTAMVAMVAWYLAQVAIEDPKMRIAQRREMEATVKSLVTEARVAANNEAGYPQSTDFEASFVRARNWGMGWGGVGNTFVGSDMTVFSDYGLPWGSLSLGSSVF